MGVYHMGILFQLALFVVVTHSKDMSDFIPPNYMSDFPPPPEGEDGKHHVRLSIRFINLLDVNELTSSVQFSCFFRVYWVDLRLRSQLASKRAPLTVSEPVAQRLWRPDIIVENTVMTVKNGIMKPTVYNGRFWGQTMLVSNYLSLRVGCSFEYGSYPFDVQICSIVFTNMGMTKGDIELDWAHPPYSMERNNFLAFQDRFIVRLCEDFGRNVRRTKLGEHPQKTLLIVLERNYMVYVVQLFVPTILFVLVAWLSVLVPPTMLRTRLLLITTNMLTLFSLFVAISHAEDTFIPKVSYLTALSLWMYMCVMFIFSSMVVVIVDIRLIAILTQPRRRRRVRKILMNVYHRRRTIVPVDSIQSAQAVEAENAGRAATAVSNAATASAIDAPATSSGDACAATAAAAAATTSTSTVATAATAAAVTDASTAARQRRLTTEFVADAVDEDPFVDAAIRPMAASAVSLTDDDEVEYRRHVWLTLTASWEQMYLFAFPVLFCVFMVLYFWFFTRRRRLHLDHVLDMVRAPNASAGCWCTDHDDWIGCFAKHHYPT